MTSQPTDAVLEEKSSSYIELFFDLVFVFAITQISALLRDDPTFAGLGKGALLMLMLWWTWSIYTWTTNWTGTDRLGIRLSLIGAMAAALVMAIAVPKAFAAGGFWFAVTYLLTRLFAAAMYWVGSRHHPAQRAALMTFLPLSMLAPLVVLAGTFFEAGWRVGVWIGALLVDMASAARAGRGTWEVDPGHFAERNALFVLIALGESIVAIGLGASRTEAGAEVVITLALAFAGAAVLWWSYFDQAARAAEGYLRMATGQERGRFARDAYTLLHIPLVLGVVLYAVAAEAVVAHPDLPLPAEFRFALAVGVSLVLLAVVAGTYRATRQIPKERLVAALILIALAAGAGGIRADLLTVSVVTVVGVSLWRERTHRWPRAPLAPSS